MTDDQQFMRMPATGLDRDVLFERIESYRADDIDWKSGRAWAYVFDPGEEARAVIKRAYGMFLSENGLDPTAFPSLLRLEREVVSICAAHLRAGPDVVGNFTSGGTESIILAVKAARDYARSTGKVAPEGPPGELVLPSTAHAAFHKAAHYLGLETVVVDVDPETFRAVPEALEAAVSERTVMVVASAVSYAHCVVDPVPEIAAFCRARDLWLHVDGCMGGFLLPYFRRLGAQHPDFDFSVPGVRSISIDLHKYAFAAKGASVVLYENKHYRRHQIFTCANWAGYTVSNATVQSSKSGGPVAAAWAVLHHFGDAGYMKIAKQLLAATQRVIAWVDAHPDLRNLGRSDMSHVAFASDTVDIFALVDAMNARGWYVQAQLSYESSAANVHLCLNPESLRWLDQLLADFETCIQEVRGAEPGPLVQMVSQAVADIDVADIDDDALRQMLTMAGAAGGADELGEERADISRVLDTLEPALRERVVTEFMNESFSRVPAQKDETR